MIVKKEKGRELAYGITSGGRIGRQGNVAPSAPVNIKEKFKTKIFLFCFDFLFHFVLFCSFGTPKKFTIL